jgi:hypothetical protein
VKIALEDALDLNWIFGGEEVPLGISPNCCQTRVGNIRIKHTGGYVRPDFDTVLYEVPSLTISIFELVELNLI